MTACLFNTKKYIVLGIYLWLSPLTDIITVLLHSKLGGVWTLISFYDIINNKNQTVSGIQESKTIEVDSTVL